jgi:hypothetical protein
MRTAEIEFDQNDYNLVRPGFYEFKCQTDSLHRKSRVRAPIAKNTNPIEAYPAPPNSSLKNETTHPRLSLGVAED